jgi:hypothetical protein
VDYGTYFQYLFIFTLLTVIPSQIYNFCLSGHVKFQISYQKKKVSDLLVLDLNICCPLQPIICLKMLET